MLYLYTGTDREKVREALNAEVARIVAKKHAAVLRVTDANTIDDARAALQGAGMFAIARVVLLEGILENEDMRALAFPALKSLSDSSDDYFILEEKPDAATRRAIEKYAKKTEHFDAAKGKRDDGGMFSLASALARGDKKSLWVDYQKALARGERPEALHGILFWGAKRTLLSVSARDKKHAEKIIAELAELPHKARRRSFELEYALEHYLLTVNKA